MHAHLSYDPFFDLRGSYFGLLFGELLPLMRSSFGVRQDALGLLVGARPDLLGFAPSFGQERLAVGFGLLCRAASRIGLLHAFADALRASVEHADDRLQQHQPQ